MIPLIVDGDPVSLWLVLHVNDEAIGSFEARRHRGGYYACPLVPGALSAREGEECDCGLGARRMAILGPLAHEFADHPDYRAEEWAA